MADQRGEGARALAPALAAMRENRLGNRIFAASETILDHWCDAWNRLIDQPWRIISIGLRAWAHEF